ncbi:hypothetical protein [Thiocapsa sp.]|uniref:hypothetical protein n=1 Tax=Thiocapsa sp. TaxID=2024551 RepID=UPI0025F7D667|nr:hypothetical protein [Thiocapsa sp.]
MVSWPNRRSDFSPTWLDRHHQIADQSPAVALYKRMQEVLADGVMDSDEERDLLATLQDLTGAPIFAESAASMSAALLLDDRVPNWPSTVGPTASPARLPAARAARSSRGLLARRKGVHGTDPQDQRRFYRLRRQSGLDSLDTRPQDRRCCGDAGTRHPIALVGAEHWYETVSLLTLNG